MYGLRQFPAVAVCFARDEILDVGELAVTEALDVALRRRAAVRVDGENPNPEWVLPTCARDPFEPGVARSPDQHEQQNRNAYASPHDDLGLKASGRPRPRV